MRNTFQYHNLSIYAHPTVYQKEIRFHPVNMGCRSSRPKINKEGEKQKVFKVGLSFGRNDLKVEGNFQAGYHSKVKRKYVTVGGICKPTCIEIQGEEEEKPSSLPVSLPQIQQEPPIVDGEEN